MARRLTLEEIGRLAGVSRATVSRVINKPENVTPELRERVERVIAETGFQPNIAARSLASRRSNILGLIIPSVAQMLFTDPYFPALIQGISQACNDHQQTLSLFIFYSRKEQNQLYQRATQSGLVDGLIVTADEVHEAVGSSGETYDPLLHLLRQRQIPFVYMGRPSAAKEANFVDVDNVAGAYIATNHLIRLGRQRIAHIGAPLKTNVGRDRLQGYMNALEERERTVDNNLIAYGDFTEDSGYTAMRELLQHHPDAVFVASDTMAVGAIQAIQFVGLHVPDDVAVVGFDDLPPAEKADPPLTTIHQPIAQTSKLAVETLLEVLEVGAEPVRHIILPTKLVIRESCGAL